MSRTIDGFKRRDSTLKSRFEPSRTSHSRSYRLVDGVTYFPRSGFSSTGWGQETVSFSNPGYLALKRAGYSARDIGGPFYTRSVKLDTSGTDRELSTFPGGLQFKSFGALWPNLDVARLAIAIYQGKMDTLSQWQTDHGMPIGELIAIGQSLSNSSAPTAPAFKTAQFIGELRDGLFDIPLAATRRGRINPGSEYLNAQFGILPTASDVKKFRSALNSTARSIEQLRRDSGRIVNRRRTLDSETTSTSSTTSASVVDGTGAGVTSYLQRFGVLTETTTVVRTVWWSGAFQFYFPSQMGELETYVRYLNFKYSLAPTPGTAWELTPFSWLADYFTNVDDAISGTMFVGMDGSVPVRGYAMCRTVATTVYEWTGELNVAGTWEYASLRWTVQEIVKQRVSSRPYGLGFTGPSSLSLKQLSILAALGISAR